MGATPAQAASVGYIRLAHLSPDTAPVDVYLDSLSGTVPQQVFRGVGYGVMSQYLKLPVGGYSVSMRKTNSVPSDPILLTTSVNVTSNSAYTIAGVGKNVDIGLRVLKDDLKLPTGNKSKVRIIQASLQLPVINVSVSGGAIIANNVAFATTTGYQLVSPGQWQLQITPAGGGNTTDLSADLGSGSVYSLLVLDGGNGTVKAELRTDASRQDQHRRRWGTRKSDVADRRGRRRPRCCNSRYLRCDETATAQDRSVTWQSRKTCCDT
jgi:hypothetical protein